MKNKSFKAKYRFCIVALSIAALLFTLPFFAFAANIDGEDLKNDIIVENYNLTEKYSLLLSEESAYYSSLDSDPQKTASKNVLAVINVYRKQLLDLQAHVDVGTRPLTREVTLAYEKGRAAGKLSWIYYHNLRSIESSDAISRIKACYDSSTAQINNGDDSVLLEALGESLCARLNSAAYEEMIRELALENDSLACAAIIAGGIEQLSTVNSSDPMGREHLALLNALKKSLHVQRSRDFLTSQLEDIYGIIAPGKDFSSDPTVALFTYKIRNAEAVDQMNSALQTTLYKLTETPESLKYSYLFSSELRESISLSIAKYDKESLPADLLPLFAKYQFESARAAAKDEIYSTVYAGGSVGDAELLRIEQIFNAAGGRLDCLKTREELDVEMTRARYLKLCYNKLCEVDSQIEIVLRPYNPPTFLEKSKTAYSGGVQAILKIELGADFESACRSALSGLSEALGEILRDSKAERYLLDHKAIISKATDTLSPSDELALRQALSDYSSLERDVAITLAAQINSIAEKYNSVLSQIIRTKLPDDALYLDLCENFCEELKLIPKNNIDVFYNKCDLVLRKSDSLCTAVCAYRNITLSPLYESYNADERESLIVICREITEAIRKLDLDDKALFDTELSSLTEDAKTALNRANESVRIRVAARGSENPQVKAILADARARIKASFDLAEMIAISDKSIFKINRLLTADEIDVVSQKTKLAVSSMKFLSSADKQLLTNRIDTVQSEARATALLCENMTVLKFVWESFSQQADAILDEAEDSELVLSRDAHLEMLKKECLDLTAEIRSMIYLNESEGKTILDKISTLQSSFKSSVVSAQNGAQIESEYAKTVDVLHSLALSASGTNLSNYKNRLILALADRKAAKQEYSPENFEKLLKILSDFEIELKAAGSIADCDALQRATLEKIELVSNLLDDAKREAIAALEDRVTLYRQKSSLYSSEALALIDQTLNAAKREISDYKSLSEIVSVKNSLEKYMHELASIKRDYVSSSEGLDFLAEGALYPLQYNFSNGYKGVIYLPGSIPPDVKLSINNIAELNKGEIEKQLRDALKNDKVKFYSSTPNTATLKLIRNASVALGVDVSLSDDFSVPGPFTLQMLLPSDLDEENLLGVIFVCDDGSVEFYSIDRRDSLISLSLGHLSSYYILAEKTADLTWLIVLLSIMIGIELLVLAVFAAIRFIRKRKENNMLPMISPCFLSPLSVSVLTKIKPSGAVSTVVLMSVGALALGCAIALLARAELGISSSPSKRKAAQKPSRTRPSDSCEKRFLPRHIHKPLLRSKRYELAEGKPDSENFSDEAYYTSENEKEEQDQEILCAVASSAERQGSYSDGVEYVESNVENEDYAQFGSAKYKTEINLDVIAQKFSAGDLVTLDALKRKRLVPKKTDYVKILARGALSKPLIIEANDFSRAAEEMLVALGGEAIRVKR